MTRDQNIRLKFGRYQGITIAEVPCDYLRGLVGRENLNAWLREVIQESINRREREESEQRALAIDAIYRQQLREIVSAWFRKLVRKYHPDTGGSHDAMIAITDAKDQLKDALGIE